MKGYLVGQCANVIKSALWWTSFSPLIYALLRNEENGVTRDSAIGAMRVAFNVAMLLLSPLAGALIDRSDVRYVLLMTTIGRGIIWGVLLPLCWYYLHASTTFGDDGILYPLLVFLSFADGVNVAFANVVDIDMGGVDLLAKQHGIQVSDSMRVFFNTVHQIVFDASMVLFTPGMAFFSWYVADVLSSGNNTQSSILGNLSVRDATTGGMVIVFAGVFMVMSAISFVGYCCYIPYRFGTTGRPAAASLNTPLVGQPENFASPVSWSNGEPGEEENGGLFNKDEQPQPPVSCCSLLRDIVSGLGIMCANPPVRWRILFVGIEVALEDAMVAVMLPEYALTEYDMCKGQDDCVLPLWFGPQHNGGGHSVNSSIITSPSPQSGTISADGAPICASIWTALLIGFGKIAAVLAAGLFHRCWTVPKDPSGYRPLFVMIFLSSVSTLLLPLSRIVAENNYNSEARIMIFGSTFLFFLFSAPAKIGLETLLQGLAADLAPDIQGKIFGVIGTAVTSIDALIILAMTLVFGRLKQHCLVGSSCEERALTTALWVSSGIYVTHGILELVIGPWLMIPSSGKNEENDDGNLTTNYGGIIEKPEAFSSPRQHAGSTTMFPASPRIARAKRDLQPWER